MELHDESDPLSSSDFKTMKELAISIYREVWKEFYSWEPDECRQLTASLARKPPVPRANYLKDIAKAVSELHLIVSFRNIHSIGSKDHGNPRFQIMRYMLIKSTHTQLMRHVRRRAPTRPCMKMSRPNMHKSHSFHMRTNQNSLLLNMLRNQIILVGANWKIQMVRILSCIGQEYSLSSNSKVEMIQLETARRLQFKEGFSPEHIDHCGILRELNISNESGLIWDTFQRFVRSFCFNFTTDIRRRDPLQWPGSFTLMPQLATDFSCHEDDLLTRISSAIQYFCPNLNCISPKCHTHCKHKNFFLCNYSLCIQIENTPISTLTL
jgi:hypothetical protein